jgi:hypothetical protein
MNCVEAREAMLIAEPAALWGGGDSPLATHIASCSTCSRIAIGFRTDLRQLSMSVARRSSRRIALFTALPAAAAILIVASVVVREGPAERPALAAQRPARIVSVDVAPGQRAAVLKTADSSVTVVWLIGEGK